jgi:hypothetical protein
MTFVAEVGFDVRGDGGTLRGIARVAQPRPDRDAWRCDFEVQWPGFERSRYAMGADSWQALQLAMQSVATELFTCDECKDGKLSEFGRPLASYDDLTEWLGVRPLKVLQQ